jgi:hypothetical protein
LKTAAFVLSIFTLNATSPRDARQAWINRLETIREILAFPRTDAAAFQDIWQNEGASVLAEAAGHPYRAHEPALGLMVSSRRRIIDRAALDLGNGGGILRTGLDAGGMAADVYSVKLAPETSPDSAIRLDQLLTAAEFVRNQSRERPLILLGDLAASSDDKEAEIFMDLLGVRDLCVSHGDEMCGRTFEDRRTDYILIPYSSRPPRETARTAFTGLRRNDGEAAQPSPRFGLAARLDYSWRALRLAAQPEGRIEALETAIERLAGSRIKAATRAKYAGWLPWRGTGAAILARDELARFAAAEERARSALARAANPNERFARR